MPCKFNRSDCGRCCSIFNSNISLCNNYEDLFYYLCSGYTALLVDGYSKALVIETRLDLDRGVVESSSETIVRGPKDSFTENHSKNLGLIRKRIKDINLVFSDVTVGVRTKTKVSVAYIKDIANLDNVSSIQKQLEKINIEEQIKIKIAKGTGFNLILFLLSLF